ncbi:MAG: VanZ family protein [Bacilli bacterium]|nr:VanZ family protein [Bacilli bacterium]
MKKSINKFLVLGLIFTILAVAINAFIVYQSCLGGTKSTSWSEPVAEAVADVINTIKPDTITTENFEPFSISIRKIIGHFGLFGINGIISTLAIYFDLAYFNKMKLLYVGLFSSIFGFLIAGLTEIIQYFVPGRAGLFTDVLIDFSGFLLAVLGIIFIIFIISREIKKRENKMLTE